MNLIDFLNAKQKTISVVDNRPTSIGLFYKQRPISQDAQFDFFTSFSKVTPGLVQKFGNNEIEYIFDTTNSIVFVYIITDYNYDVIPHAEIRINLRHQDVLAKRAINGIKFSEEFMEDFYNKFKIKRPHSYERILVNIKQHFNLPIVEIEDLYKSKYKDIFEAAYLFSSINRHNKIDCIGFRELKTDYGVVIWALYYNRFNDKFYFQRKVLNLKYSESDFVQMLHEFDMEIQSKIVNSMQDNYKARYSIQAVRKHDFSKD